jgi:hypothetical protein
VPTRHSKPNPIRAKIEYKKEGENLAKSDERVNECNVRERFEKVDT